MHFAQFLRFAKEIDMVDPHEALKILEQYYATVTPEQFWGDWQRAMPKGQSLQDEWIGAGIEKPPPTSQSGSNQN